MEKNLVSIIITTYNRKNLLVRCIESVLSQTYKNLEIIIVDDCSSDGTYEYLLEMNDGRIKILRNLENSGSNYSRNIGFKKSSGEFIAFLDDDDEWYRQKIEKQIQTINESNAGVVYCGFDLFTLDKYSISFTPSYRGWVEKEILKRNFIGSPTPLIDRKAFESIGGYDESLSHCQDWDLWIRLSSIVEIDYVDLILARYNVHGIQKSSQLIQLINSRIKLLNKYYNKMSKPIIADHQLNLAYLFAIKGDRLKTKKYLLDSMHNNIAPSSIMAYILFSIEFKLFKLFLLRGSFHQLR